MVFFAASSGDTRAAVCEYRGEAAVRCSKCEFDNPAGMRFCGKCRTALAPICPACSFENPPGFDFCGQCAAALRGAAGTAKGAAAASKPAAAVRFVAEEAPPTLEGERKTVTALFADIKGSTELMEELDPEEARAIIDPALTLMIDAAHRYDGYVVQSTGDGVFALFGAPVAHEDHPQRALYAALRMQEELRRYSAKVVAEGSSPIQGRVGINTGEVVVRSIRTGAGQVEYTPIGHTTNLASRMQTAAPVGSIAVSENTRRLCEGYFILKPLGPTRVKGVTEPVNVYEVTGLGPLRTRLQRSAGRGLTKFVGREREMEALHHAADQARAGHGQIVAAIAEAGTGKSRLYFEFKAKNQSGWMVLEAFSVSHGKASAYLPVLDLLHSYFKIAGEDDDRTRREKVAGKIAMLDRSLEDTRPYLFSLLGIVEGDDPLAQMDGQIKRRRTLEAIKRIVLRESLNQPLIIIFEDLHWMDSESQALLNMLADAIATAKILLMVNYRPEYSHQWNSKTYYTQLRLDPLGRESADEMLDALLGAGTDLAALKRLIAEKTQGNPFFIEEMVQGLFEAGALQRNGDVHLLKPLGELRIPATVQAMLASRIDRLPAPEKELLQTLAVLGKEFSLSHLKASVEESDAAIERMLNDLQVGEFIYEQPASGEVEYTFKHALTQEVAYHSILSERRKELHERAGAALEALAGERLDDHLTDLARHYSRSDNLTKAIEYLGRAGNQAAQHWAFSEAIEHLVGALELLKRLPETAERDQRELAILTALGPPLMVTKGWGAPEAEQRHLRAGELSRRSGTPAQRFASMIGLFGLALVQGQLEVARQREPQLLSFAEQQQDPTFMLEAHHSSWSVALSRGELAQAESHVEQGLALYEQRLYPANARLYTGHDPVACGLGWGALSLWLQGYPEAARRRVNQGLARANELRHPPSVAFAHVTSAQLHQLLRDRSVVRGQSDAAMTIATEGGFPHFLAWASILRGWTMVTDSRAAEGATEVSNGLEALSATGTRLWITYALALHAEVYGKEGKINQGLATIEEALAAAHNNAEFWWEAEIHRLKGEMLLRQDAGNRELALNCIQRAIEIARQQNAKSWELRATMSLARLLVNQGKRDEVREMLARIYNWFTEGFDTADLIEAKALLNELGQ
jgi:class 3 adenylate cyclase/predicted ATPase